VSDVRTMTTEEIDAAIIKRAEHLGPASHCKHCEMNTFGVSVCYRCGRSK